MHCYRADGDGVALLNTKSRKRERQTFNVEARLKKLASAEGCFTVGLLKMLHQPEAMPTESQRAAMEARFFEYDESKGDGKRLAEVLRKYGQACDLLEKAHKASTSAREKVDRWIDDSSDGGM